MIVWRKSAVLVGALVLAALVQSPALYATLYDDDYQQLGYLTGHSHPHLHARHWLDLYNFGDVAFWRPIASALMTLDWSLFRGHLWAYHLHSLCWYLALVIAVAALLWRSLPSVAAPALLVFALGRAAGTSVLWWCNRHLLVAALLVVLALIAHVRGRRWLALGAMAVALLASESALAGVALLLAYELVHARVRTTAPIAALAIVYLVLHGALGYGVHNGMWDYYDPMREPVRFAGAAVARLPDLGAVLLGGGLTGAPARLVALVLVGAAIAFALRPGWSGLAEAEARTLRWLLVGAFLALPISLASPQPNVRLLPSLAAAALIATLARLLAGPIALALVAIHAIAAPLVVRAEVARESMWQRTAHYAVVGAPVGPADRDLLVLSGWSYLWQGQMALDIFRPDTRIASWRQFDLPDRTLLATRTAPETLELTDGDKTTRVTLRASDTVLILREGRLLRVEAPDVGTSRRW